MKILKHKKRHAAGSEAKVKRKSGGFIYTELNSQVPKSDQPAIDKEATGRTSIRYILAPLSLYGQQQNGRERPRRRRDMISGIGHRIFSHSFLIVFLLCTYW